MFRSSWAGWAPIERNRDVEEAPMKRYISVLVVAAALVGCGGSTSSPDNSSGGTAAAGASGASSLPDAGPGGSATGGASGAGGSAPKPSDGGLIPLMPEMPPTQVDNPTHSRLIQLYVGSS